MSNQFVDIQVSPSLAASVLELRDLRLIKLIWEMVDGPAEPPYGFDLEPQLGYTREDDWVSFNITHHFAVSSQNNRNKTILEGDLAYQASYHISSSVQLNDTDLILFGNSTVILAVYPFLRELLHTLTARSGLPPIVLPLLRTHITGAFSGTEQSECNRDSTTVAKTAPRTAKTADSKQAERKSVEQATRQPARKSVKQATKVAAARRKSANRSSPNKTRRTTK